MKTNIYFVRHAECESNIDPFFNGEINGLTEKGTKQAKTIANYFKNRNITNIFSSDILRAKLTAKEISDSLIKEVIILDFLKERNLIYKGSDDYSYKEEFNVFKQRLVQTKSFLQDLPEGDFVIVSHAIFLKVLISYLLLDDLFNEELSARVSDRIIIENVSISKCMFNKEKNTWQLDYINKKIL